MAKRHKIKTDGSSSLLMSSSSSRQPDLDFELEFEASEALQESQGLLSAMGAETTYASRDDGKGGDEEVTAVTIDESTQPDWTEAEENAAKRK